MYLSEGLGSLRSRKSIDGNETSQRKENQVPTSLVRDFSDVSVAFLYFDIKIEKPLKYQRGLGLLP